MSKFYYKHCYNELITIFLTILHIIGIYPANGFSMKVLPSQ